MSTTYAKQFGGIFGGGGGGGGAVPYAGTAAIASGASSGSVLFAAPLISTPAVVACLSSSNAGADVISVLAISPATTGFSYQLAGATPDNTYTLNWIASVAND